MSKKVDDEALEVADVATETPKEVEVAPVAPKKAKEPKPVTAVCPVISYNKKSNVLVFEFNGKTIQTNGFSGLDKNCKFVTVEQDAEGNYTLK